MISNLSKLKVSDNSGVKYVKCFKVFKTYIGSIGSIIYVSYIFFDSNDIVLLNDKYELLGTRIFGPLPLELRKKGQLRLLSLASILV